MAFNKDNPPADNDYSPEALQFREEQKKEGETETQGSPTGDQTAPVTEEQALSDDLTPAPRHHD